MKENLQDGFISEKEAAKLLGVTEKTLKILAKGPRYPNELDVSAIPNIRIGNRRIWKKEELISAFQKMARRNF